MRVLIDAGHGKETPGKRSPDGTFREYLFNRNVAELLAQELRLKGIPVAMITPEEADVPLAERCRRANDWASRERCVFVSMHANAAGNGSAWMGAKGWSCYTSVGRTAADEVAECLYDAFEKEFPDRRIREDKSDGDRDWEANFYVLKHTTCPAVLLENFFYDNQEECRWLLTHSAQIRIARATADGLMRYFRKKGLIS